MCKYNWKYEFEEACNVTYYEMMLHIFEVTLGIVK